MAFKTDIMPDGSRVLGSDDEKWKYNGHVDGYIKLEIPLESTDGHTLVINDPRITENHVVLNTIASDLTGYKIVPVS